MMSAQQVLASMVAEVDAEGLGLYGLHVEVGEESAQHRWRSDDRENLYSVSKGVCALAAGMAIDEGKIRLDTSVAEVFGPGGLGDGVAEVTLEHCLRMTSGIDFAWSSSEPVTVPDLAREIISHPSRGVGTFFRYTDASTYLAMRMVGAAVGDVRDWLLPRLFDPLGINSPQWHRCPLGWIHGGSGLELRTEELSRIGRLLRDHGRWQPSPSAPAEQLVSESWVRMMHESLQDASESLGRYGLAVWEGPGPCWRLIGSYGQYVIVVPDQDAVVTMTGHEEFRSDRLPQIAADAFS